MPKALKRKLYKRAKKKFPSNKKLQGRYVYGTLNKFSNGGSVKSNKSTEPPTNFLNQYNKDYINQLKNQAAAGSEMAVQRLQSLGQESRIPDADVSNLTFEALFPYAKTLGLGLKGLRAFNAAKFTGTPGSMYRGIGTEGLKDLQKSRVLRPKQSISPIKVGAFDVAKDFNKIQKGVYASPSIKTAKRYGKGVVAEIPEGAAKFIQRYKGTNWSQKTQDLLPVENINVFKQNFFGKYKPVKFKNGGSIKK